MAATCGRTSFGSSHEAMGKVSRVVRACSAQYSYARFIPHGPSTAGRLTLSLVLFRWRSISSLAGPSEIDPALVQVHVAALNADRRQSTNRRQVRSQAAGGDDLPEALGVGLAEHFMAKRAGWLTAPPTVPTGIGSVSEPSSAPSLAVRHTASGS